MRGSRDFPSLAGYQMFLEQLFTRLNASRRERYLEEVAQLRPLPERRLDSVRRERVRVSPGSLISVGRAPVLREYSAIGEMVEARVHPDTVEIGTATGKPCREISGAMDRPRGRVDARDRIGPAGHHTSVGVAFSILYLQANVCIPNIPRLRFQGITGIYRPMCSTLFANLARLTAFRSGPDQVIKRAGRKHAYSSSRRVPAGYSSTGWSPPEPVSASPAPAI